MDEYTTDEPEERVGYKYRAPDGELPRHGYAPFSGDWPAALKAGWMRSVETDPIPPETWHVNSYVLFPPLGRDLSG